MIASAKLLAVSVLHSPEFNSFLALTFIKVEIENNDGKVGAIIAESTENQFRSIMISLNMFWCEE